MLLKDSRQHKREKTTEGCHSNWQVKDRRVFVGCYFFSFVMVTNDLPEYTEECLSKEKNLNTTNPETTRGSVCECDSYDAPSDDP